MSQRLGVIDGGQGSHSDPSDNYSWNREWNRGEHGGDSFATTTAHVDVVNPRRAGGPRVFIGGSRSITDRDSIASAVSELSDNATVVTSRTRGASAAARASALVRGLRLEVWSARIERFATTEEAYFARDEELIRSCDRVVAFWDGVSAGTAHEVDFARQLGKPTDVRWPAAARSMLRPWRCDPFPGGDAA